MGKQRDKLKIELFLLIIFTFVVSSIVIISVSSKLFTSSVEKSKFKELKNTIDFIKNNINIDNINTGFSNKKLLSYASATGKRITIINTEGDVVFESDRSIAETTNHLDRKEIQGALNENSGHDIRISASTNEPQLYYAEKFNDEYVIRLSSPMSEITEWKKQFIASFVPTLIILLIITVFIALLTISRLTKMLSNMTKSLNKKATQLTKLEKVRKDFVANVSHELKTPLTAIEGYSELLLNLKENDTAYKDYAKIIYKNSLQMENTVQDLLLLSSLENENFVLNKVETSLENIVEEVKINVKYKLEKKHITFKVQIDSDVPKKINLNEHLMVQAITNLVINAIIYSDEDSVVHLAIQKANDSIEFIVKDNGCGIPKEEQSRIFERFYRIDKARERKSGGTGLGLSIVKHVAVLHGGNISVYSLGLNKGSMFTLSIPLN